MPSIHWPIQVTLESSAKKQFLEICKLECRSVANMVRILIEQEIERRKND